jgi:hypothetical protein
MNEQSEQESRLIAEMKRHRIASPSPALKKRVLDAAQDAWQSEKTGSDDVPWTYPILRLAASIAATILLICCANLAGGRSLARWQYSSPVLSQVPQQADPGSASEDDAMLLRRAAIAASMPDRDAPQNLHHNVEQVRELLGEIETGISSCEGHHVDGAPQSRLGLAEPLRSTC